MRANQGELFSGYAETGQLRVHAMNAMNNDKPNDGRSLPMSVVTAVCVMLFLTIAMLRPAAAGVAVDCDGSAAAYRLQGIDCRCVNNQIVCGGSASRGGGRGLSSSAQLKGMVFGMVFESLLTSLFTTPQASQADIEAAQQRAAELAWQQEQDRLAREAAAQAAYEQMMQSYKVLSNSHQLGFKTISGTQIGFKTLESETELLAAAARSPFDSAPALKAPGSGGAVGGATPFFGDTMPLADIQLLVNPGNDPKVVDLRNAVTYVTDNLAKDSEKLEVALLRNASVDSGQPIIEAPDCKKLPETLRSYVEQRQKFHKTILQSQEQLTVWEDANRNALVNAARDGMEYFAGAYFETLMKRGERADSMLQIFEKDRANMVKDGLDVKKIEATLQRLKNQSKAGEAAWIAGKGNDWQTFLKDGVSGLVAQLSATNEEIKAMMADPKVQKYFATESPELNALYDISKIAADCEVFGKWVAKKVPMIALLEISYKQTYNATDWLLSFRRIAETNRINGEVMNAARSLQRHIDETYASLQQCP